MTKPVAVLRSLMQKLPLFSGKNQFFGVALRRKTLRRAVKHLFVVIDHDHLRIAEFGTDPLGLRMIQNTPLDVEMRKELRR